MGDAITRLIEQAEAVAQEAVTTITPPETLQPPLPETTWAGSDEEQDDESVTVEPGELHRPLSLPESPESVQRHNKVIWNLIHLPVKADFYTIGYAGRNIDQFVALLQAVGVSTLVDIRHTPVSQYKPDFSKENLRSALNQNDIEYVHKAEWGVPSEIRSRSVGQDTRSAIWDWYDSNVVPNISNGDFTEFRETAKPPLAFMCVETDPTACHRHRLFLALEETGLRGFDL